MAKKIKTATTINRLAQKKIIGLDVAKELLKMNEERLTYLLAVLLTDLVHLNITHARQLVEAAEGNSGDFYATVRKVRSAISQPAIALAGQNLFMSMIRYFSIMEHMARNKDTETLDKASSYLLTQIIHPVVVNCISFEKRKIVKKKTN